MVNISPLRYPGGKTKARKRLEEILLENFKVEDFDTLISPFFGGGSFEFYLEGKYKFKIEANDLFQPLYNFWVNCKERKEEMSKELKERLKVSKEDFKSYREDIKNVNSFQSGIIFFIINRCSFSGSTFSGGFSLESSKKRFTPSSISRVEKLDLSRISFYNLDFEIFLKKEFSPKSFLFLDPPYYLEEGSKLYGEKGDLHSNFNHVKLREILGSKNNWMLTYNNCEYIRELYKDYKIIETSWSYGMNKSKKSSEIVIINNTSRQRIDTI